MEKTVVTNPEVSKSSESQSNPSGQGYDPSKEIENRVRENLRAEYERKTTALSEKLEEQTTRLAELEEYRTLTERQKAEKERLEKGADAVEEELRIIQTDPKYRAFNERLRRDQAKVKEEARNEALEMFYDEQVNDLLLEASDELKTDPKKLRSELLKLLKTTDMDKNPIRRTKDALREYRSNLEAQKKAEEDRKKSEADKFREDKERQAREPSLEEAKKSGNVLAQIKQLGKYKPESK